MVGDKQYWRLMKLLNTGKTLGRAAALSDMDQKTARKYRHLGKPPSQVRRARTYRTRADVFADLWDEIVPFLESEPEVEAKTLLDYLSERHPNRFADSQLRTLQRRIKAWRAIYGSPKEVFFEQRHLPGHQAQSDFTCFNDLHITINRQPFSHLILSFLFDLLELGNGQCLFFGKFRGFRRRFAERALEVGQGSRRASHRQSDGGGCQSWQAR